MKQKVLSSTSLLIFLLILLYLALYKLYIPRIHAFGCFDDCYNITAGYFITKGKILYSQIPFNHQMLMAYLSAAVQQISHPVNIFQLILRHRQFVLLFGFLFNLLLVWRFKYIGICFAFVYELSKYYLFGDRFLAEGLIVYPLVYLLGIVWLRMRHNKLLSTDYLMSAIFSWFIVFIREPYVPVAMILFGIVLWGRPFTKSKKIAIAIFISLSLGILLVTPLHDYFFNIYTVNVQGVFRSEAQANNILGLGIINIVFYPVSILFGGAWNIFRWLLVGLSAIFIMLTLFFIRKSNYTRSLLMILLVLGVANLRVVPPGTIFYAAFHMLPWYALFVFSLLLLLQEARSIKKPLFYLTSLVMILIFGGFILSPSAFYREKVDQQRDFLIGYGHYLQVGEAIKALANPNNTVFINNFDEIINWVVDHPSPYKYNWFTSYMPSTSRYRDERLTMFRNTPPDFYYGGCVKNVDPVNVIPSFRTNDYVRLLEDGKPSCLFIKKSSIAGINQPQWDKAKSFLYELPKK